MNIVFNAPRQKPQSNACITEPSSCRIRIIPDITRSNRITAQQESSEPSISLSDSNHNHLIINHWKRRKYSTYRKATSIKLNSIQLRSAPDEPDNPEVYINRHRESFISFFHLRLNTSSVSITLPTSSASSESSHLLARHRLSSDNSNHSPIKDAVVIRSSICQPSLSVWARAQNYRQQTIRI
jgi:hypothetical protein